MEHENKPKKPRRWKAYMYVIALVIAAFLAMTIAAITYTKLFSMPGIDPPGDFYDAPPPGYDYPVYAESVPSSDIQGSGVSV